MYLCDTFMNRKGYDFQTFLFPLLVYDFVVCSICDHVS